MGVNYAGEQAKKLVVCVWISLNLSKTGIYFLSEKQFYEIEKSFRSLAMSVKQLSIFLENRPGRLVTVARVLGDAGCSILALSVADTKDFGILRLIVDKLDVGVQALRENDILCQTNEVTAVGIDSAPGSLASVLEVLGDSGVNVEYMYAIAEPRSTHPVMVFRFDQAKPAIAALEKAGVHIFTDEELLRS